MGAVASASASGLRVTVATTPVLELEQRVLLPEGETNEPRAPDDETRALTDWQPSA